LSEATDIHANALERLAIELVHASGGLAASLLREDRPRMALRSIEDALKVAVRYRKQAVAAVGREAAAASIVDASAVVRALPREQRVSLFMCIGDAFVSIRSSLPALRGHPTQQLIRLDRLGLVLALLRAESLRISGNENSGTNADGRNIEAAAAGSAPTTGTPLASDAKASDKDESTATEAVAVSASVRIAQRILRATSVSCTLIVPSHV